MTRSKESAATMANPSHEPRLLSTKLRSVAEDPQIFANNDTDTSDLSTPPDTPSSVDSVRSHFRGATSLKASLFEPESAEPGRKRRRSTAGFDSRKHHKSSPILPKGKDKRSRSLERPSLRETLNPPSTPTRGTTQSYLLSPDVLRSRTRRQSLGHTAQRSLPKTDLITKPTEEVGGSDKASFFEDIKYERRGPDGHHVLHLFPTSEQWADFPRVLSCARKLGASSDGCFKVVLPSQTYGELPPKFEEKVTGKAYRIKQIKRNSFWHVTTASADGLFSSEESEGHRLNVHEAIANLKKLFLKNNGRRLRQVLYRVDVPAWTPAQRQNAGVPLQSPIHPLKGDELDKTKAIIPGIHTPYVYESGPHFGATFQIHAEDYRLVSLNHLYKGRKIWMVVPSTAVEVAEKAFGRKQRCSQFMRHRAEFFFPEKLDKLGIPYRLIDQKPGETIVVLPDAYHQGFSTGYTLAEAKNYADSTWSIDTYQACDDKCMFLTAIPAVYMTPVKEGEQRVDLCADNAYDDAMPILPENDTMGEGEPAPANQGSMDEHTTKRIKVF